MVRLTLLLLFIPASAFPGNGILVDNLCTSSQEVDGGSAFYTYDGLYDYWIAVDFDPDDDYYITDISGQWMYYGGASQQGDMNFAIYLDDFDDPPVVSFMIPEEDYTESDTGFEYAGRDVYRGDIPLGNDAFGVTAGNKYWIALQMDASDGVHAAGWYEVVGDRPWYQDVFGWHAHGSTDECSYALYGEVSGVESASLGEIKALFK